MSTKNRPRQTSQRLKQIVRQHLREMWPGLCFAALCLIGYTAMELVTPWPMKIIFDHILLNKPSPAFLSPLFKDLDKFTALIVISAAMILIALLKGALAYGQVYVTSHVGYEMVYKLRRELFLHLQNLSLSFHNRSHSGELLTKVTGDTRELRDIFAESALAFGGHLLTAIGMFTVMFTLNWQLSLIVLAIFPLVCHSFFVMYRRIKTSAREQREKEGQVASRISEVLNSVFLVQAFAREKYEQERFDSASGQTLRESLRTARMEAAASRWLEILSVIGLGTVVFFGSLQALAGRMTPGDVLIFTAYVSSLYKPLRQMAKLTARFSKAAVSADRISSLLDTEPEMPDRPSAIAAHGLRGEIGFHNVSFSYDAGPPVLRELSLNVQAGERVALVGASGAGKSTIVSLILRLYQPLSGTITIDGVDIRDYQRESLRGEIGVVLQDAVLFGASIHENIAYGKPGATPAEIEKAAAEAHVHEFVAGLPDGYDTIVGERGCTLSGGQRQRLCLARAIIRRPSILILDEPTSAVDAESAALIRDAVDRLQRGKTLLMIAHQFAGMERFDRILVLENGTVVEQGSHFELLNRNGSYAELFHLQAAKSPSEGICVSTCDEEKRNESNGDFLVRARRGTNLSRR